MVRREREFWARLRVPATAIAGVLAVVTHLLAVFGVAVFARVGVWSVALALVPLTAFHGARLHRRPGGVRVSWRRRRGD